MGLHRESTGLRGTGDVRPTSVGLHPSGTCRRLHPPGPPHERGASPYRFDGSTASSKSAPRAWGFTRLNVGHRGRARSAPRAWGFSFIFISLCKYRIIRPADPRGFTKETKSRPTNGKPHPTNVRIQPVWSKLHISRRTPTHEHGASPVKKPSGLLLVAPPTSVGLHRLYPITVRYRSSPPHERRAPPPSSTPIQTVVRPTPRQWGFTMLTATYRQKDQVHPTSMGLLL